MALTRFLIASIAVHGCLLLEFRHSLWPAPNRPLGDSVLNVQIQDRAPAPSVFSRPVTDSPATKISSVHTVTPVETMTGSSPSVAAAAIEPRVPVAPAETEGEWRHQLLGELRTRLSWHLTYPPLARSRGWEGTVLLSLRVESDGALDKIRLERSSGYAVLDNAALNSLKRLDHLVEPRGGRRGRHIDMQLPVIYQLTEN